MSWLDMEFSIPNSKDSRRIAHMPSPWSWNAVRIVNGSGDPKVPMDGGERTCLFH